MSQPTESTRERRLKPMTLNLAACRADDVSLMEQAISAASKPDSIYPVQYVVQRGLSRSSSMGAVRVLTYLLNHLHGASIAALTASRVTFNEDRDKPSLEVLEILVAHGWDINPRSLSDWPLLWHVVRYPDLVKWCLDHGARVDVPDDPPKITGTLVQRSGVQHGTILSMAASHGSIETFELLRANGAPLDPSPLHDAVRRATYYAPKEGCEPASYYTEQLDMIRHLLDVVKLDVNAVRREVGRQCSTPLCIAVGRGTDQVFRELVDVLLDRGADPSLSCRTQDDVPNGPVGPARGEAWCSGRIEQAVKEWEAGRRGGLGGGKGLTL